MLHSISEDSEHADSLSSVELRGLCVDYGELRVLDQLSLAVNPGEFLVLLGPSGCGKSTLLNAIAGLQDASSGQVLISGVDVTDKLPKDRGIGMVFQSYALYPRMNVAANLGFSLKIGGVPKAEIAARVEKVARTLQLENLLRRYPAELSGGQRQRVAIGRALIRDVEIFLFDEPLSNLDAQLRATLRVEIKKLHQSIENTMIYVTHDQVEALTLADRIVVMEGGAVRQIGTPHEIYRKPQNRFVAGFVGSPAMSFIEGTLVHGDASTHFEAAGQVVLCDDYRFSDADSDSQTRAVLGIRPEDIIVCNAGDIDAKDWISAEIVLVEPMGSDQVVWTEFAEQELAIRVGGAEPFHAHEQIHFRFDLEKASIFDAFSGARL